MWESVVERLVIHPGRIYTPSHKEELTPFYFFSQPLSKTEFYQLLNDELLTGKSPVGCGNSTIDYFRFSCLQE